MQRTIWIFLLFTSTLACKNVIDQQTTSSSASFKIDGMICSKGCAAAIQKKLAGTDGVTTVTVSFESGLARVDYNSKWIQSAQLIEIIEKVNDGQYKVLESRLEPNYVPAFPAELNSQKEKSLSAPAVSFPIFPSIFDAILVFSKRV